MTKDKWVWMPHAAHFICGDRCIFHLATYVGGVVVSTVGEMKTNHNDGRDGFETIGHARLYETMVFKARKRKVEDAKWNCCPWAGDVCAGEKDFAGYNDATAAYKGHLAMCKKWAGLR